MRVLITGASRGIGKEIAKIFQENGFEVITPTRQEMDLASIDSVNAYVDKMHNTTFDVIINNAGINEISEVDKINEKNLMDTMNINLIAPILLLKGFTPKMKEQRYGRIVNIGSIWSVVSKEGRCTYSASKNGIHGVTNTLAVELAPYNILVNTVCPGFTLTELTYKNNTEEQINSISEQIPMKRMAKPDEIAKVVYFLSSKENTYLTGQKIVVDGGYTVQ